MGFALSDLMVTSPAFEPRGSIPRQHTGEGPDVSPALSWTRAPEGTQSWAVICHDPDAPLISANGSYGFVHWVLYNLPAEVTSLDEGDQRGTSGINDFGNSGYGGPMPPPGHGPHHYFFWVLALNQTLDLPAGLSLQELLQRIEPHVIGMNRLVGTYQRSPEG